MPIPTIDTTIGGANANSYIDVATADSYHDARLSAEAWFNATSDNKTRALLMAANRLQFENWLGSRVNSTQRLAWPRLYVQKVDGIGPGYGWGYGWLFGDVYLSTEIPQRVKDAQCELALGYLQGFDDGAEDQMASFSADGISIDFSSQRPSSAFPPAVAQLLSGLVSGNVLMRA
jgi:hypothetical protein